MSSDVLMVYCTCPTAEVGQQIADALVADQLAACVNRIGGVVSTYRWQGEVCRDEEVLLLIKTTAARYPALEARVRELHPYELPELLAVEVRRGLSGYLEWVRSASTLNA